MTCIGEYFWYVDLADQKIRKTNINGVNLGSFNPADHTIRDVAWDGANLWTINTSGTLKKFSTSGEPLDTISGLLTGGWGLTYDGTLLWASDPGTDSIYQFSLPGDNIPPAAPVINSTTHPQQSVWYSHASPTFTWIPPQDPSGIAGYSFLLDASPATLPDAGVDGTAATASFFSLEDGPWYFHCRARDGAGNWGSASHYRILVDTTPPSQGTIVIGGGIDTTTSTLVTLSQLGAVDASSGLGSGAAMKFSNDGLSWSLQERLATARMEWGLSQYGGDELSGMKRVFVRYKDVAGNWSASYSDEIVYNAPFSIATASLLSGALGVAYTDTLVAVGGWPPHEWQVIAGALPPGLVLETNGIIWGEPETEGTFPFTVKVADANGNADTGDYSVTILGPTIRGDVNGDSIINILDVVLLVRYILGLEQFNFSQIWAADVVCDGTINILDGLKIVNIILSAPMAKTSQADG